MFKSKKKRSTFIMKNRSFSSYENHFFKFPDFINNIFKSKNVDTDNIILRLKTGMGKDKNFCDNYICVDKEKIYVLSGTERINPLTKKNVKENEANIDFAEIEYNEYEIKTFKDFKTEDYITFGTFNAKFKDRSDYITLFHFRFSDKLFLGDFENCLRQLVKDGEVKFDENRKEDEERFCPICGDHYPSPERKICPNCMDKGKIIARLGSFIVNYKKYLAILATMLLISSLFGLVISYLNGRVLFDDVLVNESSPMYQKIGTLVAIVMLIEIATRIFAMVYGIIAARISALLVYDLKKSILGAFQRLSMSFFTGRQTGGLMSQFNQDSNSIYFFLVNDVQYFIDSVFKVLIATGMMLFISPLLTLIVYVTVPVFIISFRWLRIKLRKMYAKWYTNHRDMSAVLSDVLSGMRVVKAFSKEKDEMTRFEKKSADMREIGKKVMVTENTFFPSVFFLLDLSHYTVFLFGGFFVTLAQTNMLHITYGMFISFTLYLSFLLNPLEFFVNFMRRLVGTVNAVQRLFEIIDAVPDVVEAENPVKIPRLCGEIEFKDVEFAYEKNRKILQDINFKVEAGKSIGIVGHTGAGKSTLANLITRLYDIEKGEINIDEVNIKSLSFDDLHKMVSIVSQETYLFRGTIAENIRYAKDNASDEEIMTAAKIASAHDFIMKLPDGYETKIGNGFKDLSGGERQRISIARAVLMNPKILIMDEATAAMDTETERQIQHALSLLTKNRTTILIAHRLSTLRDVDRLLVIENGKITESGTHQELISKKGVYFNLYKMQAQALKSIGIEA